MKRQRKMFQTKEQDKSSEKDPKKMEISNLPYKGFKVMVIKVLTDLRRRMDEHSDNFKDIQNVGKYQTEIITELKNTLDGLNSRLDEVKAQISELKDKAMEITQTEQQNGKRIFKREDTLRDLWDNIKQNNIHIIGVPEGEERERKGQKNYLKILWQKTFLAWERKQIYSSRKPKKFQIR